MFSRYCFHVPYLSSAELWIYDQSGVWDVGWTLAHTIMGTGYCIAGVVVAVVLYPLTFLGKPTSLRRRIAVAISAVAIVIFPILRSPVTGIIMV
jgi:hypothetical protein